MKYYEGGPPRITLTFQAASRRELPFSFGRKTFASPFGVGGRVIPGNQYDWMILPACDGGRARRGWEAVVRPAQWEPVI